MIAGIELGGTKTVVAIGSAEGRVIEEFRFPTTLPEETLGVAIGWLRERGNPANVGIAAFGPIGVDPKRENYGRILETTKAGWSGFSLTGCLAAAFPTARIVLDTDVNAAALAEARIGAGKGLDDVAYITIGTGIGGGILSGGRLVHGALHPEFGHLKVPRFPGDDFAGVCPFHVDCLEGLASGPSIAVRWGAPAHELPAEHPAWDTPGVVSRPWHPRAARHRLSVPRHRRRRSLPGGRAARKSQCEAGGNHCRVLSSGVRWDLRRATRARPTSRNLRCLPAGSLVKILRRAPPNSGV